MHFSDIIGHQSQKKVLLDSLSMGRIPHAQLFEGDDEQGVLAMAIAYANAVVCGDDSSESNTRLKANGLIHPDIHFVFPTATTAEGSWGNDAETLILNHGFPCRRRMHALGHRHVGCTHNQTLESLNDLNSTHGPQIETGRVPVF